MKRMVSIRLEEEVRDLIRALSERSDEEFGTHLSQAQVVEMAVRNLSALVEVPMDPLDRPVARWLAKHQREGES